MDVERSSKVHRVHISVCDSRISHNPIVSHTTTITLPCRLVFRLLDATLSRCSHHSSLVYFHLTLFFRLIV